MSQYFSCPQYVDCKQTYIKVSKNIVFKKKGPWGGGEEGFNIWFSYTRSTQAM